MDNLYLPFVDGAFSFDCVRCGAKCCKGFGWGFTMQDRKNLLAKYPDLGHFVTQSRIAASSLVTMADTPTTGCWFLEDDGLCGIQAKQGYDAKPIICKLFPLNDLVHLHGYTVASLHGLCPIELHAAAPGHGGYVLKHESAMNELAAYKDALASLGTYWQESELFYDSYRDLVPLERRMRELATKAFPEGDLLELCAEQLAWAGRHHHGAPDGPEPEHIERARVELGEYKDKLWRYFELEPGEQLTGANKALFLAATPALRFQFFDEVRKRYSFGESVRLAPRWVLALSALVLVANRIKPQQHTLQSLAHLGRQRAKTLRMFTRLDYAPFLGRFRGDLYDGVPADYKASLAELVERAGKNRPLGDDVVTLGDILHEMALPTSARTLFVDLLAELEERLSFRRTLRD